MEHSTKVGVGKMDGVYEAQVKKNELDSCIYHLFYWFGEFFSWLGYPTTKCSFNFCHVYVIIIYIPFGYNYYRILLVEEMALCLLTFIF